MSSGEEPPRPPRDIQGLLRYCIENAPQMASNSESLESNFNGMSVERREWLNNALQSMTTDVVIQMIQCLDVIRDGLKSSEATNGVISSESETRMESAIDTLIDYTGSLDNASDFYQIGGFDVFRPLLESKSVILMSKTCELLSEVVQNHSICQTYALNHDLLSVLVKILDEEYDEKVKIKSLYAISCLIRDNKEAQQLFDSKLNGFSVLLRAMRSNSSSKDNKLRIKSSFLIRHLCSDQSICQTLYDLGFLTQIVGLLQSEHDSSHEHLFAALYALVSSHKVSRNECQRKELGLKNLLKNRIEFLKGKQEFLEEEEYCKELLEMCFIDNDLPESER
jgi:hsp70-interacting protein